MISGKQRNIQEDSRSLLEDRHPQTVILNADNIPASGPLLVTLNHYSRPGFFILWAALAICAALPAPSTWLMTGAWTNRTGGIDRVRTRLTQTIFKRLGQIYGLVTMPPMPPAPEEAIQRAISIRHLLGKLKEQPDTILCIAPEGMDFPGGKLGVPYPGTGRLLLQAANIMKRVLPVGVYEEDETLIISFGQPYELQVPGKEENVDRIITERVMKHIAALLPDEMRGPYY